MHDFTVICSVHPTWLLKYTTAQAGS